MEKIISKQSAFRTSVDLRLCVGVIADCGTPLGVCFPNGRDHAPVDLTVQGSGDTYRAVALTPDGEAFLSLV